MRQLWKYRKVLLAILKRIQRMAPVVLEAAKARKRLAERINAGDFDDAIAKFAQADEAAEDFIRNG